MKGKQCLHSTGVIYLALCAEVSELHTVSGQNSSCSVFQHANNSFALLMTFYRPITHLQGLMDHFTWLPFSATSWTWIQESCLQTCLGQVCDIVSKLLNSLPEIKYPTWRFIQFQRYLNVMDNGGRGVRKLACNIKCASHVLCRPWKSPSIQCNE